MYNLLFKSEIPKKALKGIMFGTVLAGLSACDSYISPGSHSFSVGGGAYPTAQTVKVEFPSNATNIFVTTDSIDPWPAEDCYQQNTAVSVNVNQSMAIKIRYDQYGSTFTDTKYYFIEDVASDGGHLNRDLLDTWETFFVKAVLRNFDIPDQDFSRLTIHDGQGGTVVLETRITDRGWIFEDPEEANQTYFFDNFHYTDPDTGQSFVIESGKIYGYRNENRGYYNTELDGEPIVVSGDVNGWAQGNFLMDGDGNTTSGYYRIFCEDAGCANRETIYGLNTAANQFIEVAPTYNDSTLTCSIGSHQSEFTDP